ncbi:MAG: response regulator [Gammaproteobacteria bacterium]|nr:response regulator [Gammaproteobacteria bacterium]
MSIATSSHANRKSILTIEDESTIRHSFRDYLEDLDYIVYEADDGRAGLELFKQKQPDLLLIDIRMPKMNGLEVLREVNKLTHDTPVIVVSGTSGVREVVEALRLGAWDYLVKPIPDMHVLRHAVESALERADLLRANTLYREHLEEEVARRTEELKQHQEHLEEMVDARTEELRREVAERKLAEQRVRDIALSSSDWFWEMNGDLRFTYISSRFFQLSGFTPEEVLGKSRKELVAIYGSAKASSELESNEQTMIQHRGIRNFEYPLLLKDGTTMVVRSSGVPMFDAKAQFSGYRGSGTDVTELRSTQEKLQQSEKLAALGGLVAGVSHEINTPVGISITAATHLRDTTRSIQRLYSEEQLSAQELEEYLADADQASSMIYANLNRAAELIKSFKQIAVDQTTSERRLFELGSYVREVLLSLNPRIRKTGHQVHIEGDQEIKMFSYPGAVSQIITNLVMNSLIHGFEGMDNGNIRITLETDAQHARFIYQDDGKGMDKEQLKKIFEPFYTTKRGAGGTGLGMNILYNLVTETLQGSLQSSSSPGHGVRFEIRLPLNPGATEE